MNINNIHRDTTENERLVENLHWAATCGYKARIVWRAHHSQPGDGDEHCPYQSEPWRFAWESGWQEAETVLQCYQCRQRINELQELWEGTMSERRSQDGWGTSPPHVSEAGNLYWLQETGKPRPRSVFVLLFRGEVCVCDPNGGPRRASNYVGALWKGPVTP